MTPVSTIPGAELDERTLNFIESGLEIAYSYYLRAPAFFYIGAGLIAWKIAWSGLAKMRGKSGD